MEAIDNNAIYIFPKSISANLHQVSIDRFLSSKKLYSAYKSCGKLNDYISNLVNENKVSLDELSEFLFAELFYGYHKATFVHKIMKYETDLLSEKNIKDIIFDNYRIRSINYNKLSTTYFTGSERKDNALAAVKIIKDNNKICKIRLIFVERVRLMNENKQWYENSYIPIEINLEKNLIITKVYPKSFVADESKRYQSLAKTYTNRVLMAFNLKKDAYGHDHKKVLYNIYSTLVNEVIDKVMQVKSEITENMELLTEEFSENILESLGMVEIARARMKINNIYDINLHINRVIENIVISDILHEASEQKTGLTGQISLLKFNDGNMVRASLRATKRKGTLFGSDAYFGLRQSIDNKQKLEKIQVVWYVDKHELAVEYNATDLEQLELHFYEKLYEEEFYLALEKYEEHE